MLAVRSPRSSLRTKFDRRTTQFLGQAIPGLAFPTQVAWCDDKRVYWLRGRLMTSLIDPTTLFLYMICPYLIGSKPPLVLFCARSVFSKPKNNMPKCIVLIKIKIKNFNHNGIDSINFNHFTSLLVYISRPSITIFIYFKT